VVVEADEVVVVVVLVRGRAKAPAAKAAKRTVMVECMVISVVL